jgi:hypothetical protein
MVGKLLPLLAFNAAITIEKGYQQNMALVNIPVQISLLEGVLFHSEILMPSLL